jgi:hypothetical protein
VDTTICKTIDPVIYFVAHKGENPSNEEGFLLVEAAFESELLC